MLEWKEMGLSFDDLFVDLVAEKVCVLPVFSVSNNDGTIVQIIGYYNIC